MVNSNSNDPAVTFPDWWEDEAPNHFSVAENQAAVATLTDVTIAGTTQQNVFVVGDVYSCVASGCSENHANNYPEKH